MGVYRRKHNPSYTYQYVFPTHVGVYRVGCIEGDLLNGVFPTHVGVYLYKCDCGLEIDRDLNAAINLKNRAKHAQINACGENVRPQNIEAISLKQEAGGELIYV